MKMKQEHIFICVQCVRTRSFDCLRTINSFFFKNPHCRMVFTVSLDIRHFPILMVFFMGGERDYREHIHSYTQNKRNETKTKTEIVNNDLFLYVLITFCFLSSLAILFLSFLFYTIFGILFLCFFFLILQKFEMNEATTVAIVHSYELLPTPEIKFNYLLNTI